MLLMKSLIQVLMYFYLATGFSPDSTLANPGSPPERGLGNDALYAGKVFLHDAGHIATSPFRITSRQALVWGGILATTVVLYNNDQAIVDAVHDSRDQAGSKWFHELGEFCEPVGHMGVMNRYYVGGLVLSYGLGSDKATRIFGEILESHFIAGVGKVAIQSVAGRARPHSGLGSESWGNDDATSFPSGHSINIFQLATVLSHHAKRKWFTIGAYTIAAAVGVQRVSSDAHWPSDVLLSAAFGTAIARCVVNLHEQYGGPRPAVTATANGPAVAVSWRF